MGERKREAWKVSQKETTLFWRKQVQVLGHLKNSSSFQGRPLREVSALPPLSLLKMSQTSTTGLSLVFTKSMKDTRVERTGHQTNPQMHVALNETQSCKSIS
jgi:hypothetical protein